MGGCQDVSRVFWVVTVVAVSQLDFLSSACKIHLYDSREFWMVVRWLLSGQSQKSGKLHAEVPNLWLVMCLSKY